MLDKQVCVLERLSFDTLEFLNLAKKHRILEERLVENLKKTLDAVDGTSDDEKILEKLKVFIFELAKCMKFSDFVLLVERAGYTTLAKGLRCLRYGDEQAVPRMTKQTNDSPVLHHLFSNMKRVVDNRERPNRVTYFRNLTDQTFNEISICKNETQRNTMATQAGVLVWLQTQLYSVIADRKHILTEFRSRMASLKIADSSFFETVFYSKLACTAALGGEFDLAVAYIVQAEIFAEQCTWPFARTIVHHDRQFVFRKQNVEHYERSHVQEIIDSCEKGLASLVDIPEEKKVLIQRIFLLNMVQALLGIGTYLEIDVNREIDRPTIDRAKGLLLEVENLSKVQAMEKRRKMMFLLCKGRVAELKHEENEAIEFVDKSKLLTESGGILSELEKKNIEIYSESLSR